MRRAATVIGLGAFFLTMALLLRFYAYPRLAVVPLDQNTQQVVQDTKARFFDADKVAAGSGTITTKVTVVGDPAASRRAQATTGRDVVVLDMWRSSDNNGEAPPMDASTGRVAIDRHTGEALSCCGESADGRPTRYSGQVVKFPFQTRKTTYRYWDTTTGATMRLRFAGEDEVRGLKTYRFTGTVPLQKFRTQDVPRKLFGLPDESVVADRLYQNERTVWIEPETGVIIKIREQQHQVLRIPDPGAREVQALQTDSVMTDATVRRNVEEYATKATLLRVLRLWAPLGLGLLGLLLLAGGLFASTAGRPGSGHPARERRDGGRADLGTGASRV